MLLECVGLHMNHLEPVLIRECCELWRYQIETLTSSDVADLVTGDVAFVHPECLSFFGFCFFDGGLLPAM